MYRQTFAKISKSALLHNFRAMAGFAENSKVMAVVKANAYGHGAAEIATLLAQNGVSWFGVATPDEAFEIRDLCPRVFVLGPLCEEAYEECIRREVSFPVFTKTHIRHAIHFAKRAGMKARVHIKVDTGMNRVGLKNKEDFKELLGKFCEHVELEGLFTHFANADSDELEFTYEQMDEFEEYIKIAKDLGFNPMCHAANSAAIAKIPGSHLDMLRLGIALYGYHPHRQEELPCELKPVMSIVSKISHIKEVEEGESISYSRTYIVRDKKQRIATAPIGYADGYRRSNSNRAHVLVNGKRCKIRGRVCMDQIMFDVTDVPDARVGSEVVLMGKSGEQCITADDLANIAYTINYEILTSISARMPLVYED